MGEIGTQVFGKTQSATIIYHKISSIMYHTVIRKHKEKIRIMILFLIK